MTAKERTQAAARIITAHPKPIRTCYCHCRHVWWSPLHVAQELDKAGLLCALAEVPDA